jgi:hypothetical protein
MVDREVQGLLGVCGSDATVSGMSGTRSRGLPLALVAPRLRRSIHVQAVDREAEIIAPARPSSQRW